MKKVFFIAGEASGDLHASNLMRAMLRLQPDLRLAGLGGDLMAQAGCHLYQNYREMAFMGFVAVMKNIDKVKRNFQIAKKALLMEKPDLLVLIDYPSFNLKMAAFCREYLPETKIVYYIPPKVWAWKSWRIHKICQLSDRVLGIFPFEETYYKKRGYACAYVGNPTVDSVREYQETNATPTERTLALAILPGSRKGEISKCLPKMLRAAQDVCQQLGDRPIWIAGAPGIDASFYSQWAGDLPVVFGDTYRLLSTAEAAIVNSGTATLEAALLNCPQVPVYHITCGWLDFLRPLVFPSPFFTLPNIIMQREVVREKIASKFTVKEVRDELLRLLTDPAYKQQQLADYEAIRATLGTQRAAETAASLMCN